LIENYLIGCVNLTNENNATDKYYAITLIDEEGKEHDFEILDIIETTEDGKFYALLPVCQKELLSDDYDENDFYSYYVFKPIFEDGEEKLTEVFDRKLLSKIGKIFDKRFKKLYNEIAQDEDFV
jgi:uncharacterized protein YrzB (UPF0473 family)